ncbi:MAG: hypothetical protein QOI35_3451, partial [Cryptosporangiaceae bacterium]|nr:hypothetical protein [Cryptosporangiaceae bacterium]
MCGICGASGPEAERSVAVLNQLQRHRGPDHTAAAPAGRYTLGNTRLAIVDLTESGNQPLVSSDGAIVCVFNGEIYNHRELISQHGLRPTSDSDGGVVPELYSRFGTAALRLLRGMFALAIVDLRDGHLLLARDPLGIKPLYWCRRAGDLLFASEARALTTVARLPGVAREALAEFLRCGHLASGQAPFRGIESLAPNEWAEFDGAAVVRRGEVRPQLWDDPPPPPSGEEVRETLLESVRLHLRSDVPTALLLSSGIDSAAIAWAAAGRGASVTAFTVDVGGGRSEAAAAAQIARHYGHGHVVLTRAVEASDVARFVAAMQRPSIDGLNSYLVCEAVAERGVKVALSGLGGDEAIGGYRHFRLLRALRILAWADRISPALRRALLGHLPMRGPLASGKACELLGPDGPRDADGLSRLQRRLFGPADIAALTGSPQSGNLDRGNLDRTRGSGRSARELSGAELETYLQGMLLPDADAYSMASGVELRVPFVDVDFLRAALAVDPHRGIGKRGFAHMLGEPLLVAAAARPKQGFSVPMDQWMREGALTALVAALADTGAPVWQHLDQSAGLAIVERWRRGGRWAEAWSLAVLNAWLGDLTAPSRAGARAGSGTDGRSPCA